VPEVERGGARVRYEAAGAGPPVLLGHGFLFDHRMWEHQVAGLAADHRVIALDFRGHGGSRPGPSDVHELVDDVIAVLDAERVERAAWVGLSLGGMVALRAALRFPDRVGALALLDTDAETWGFGERMRFQALGVAARAVGWRPVLPQILRVLFGATTRRERSGIVETWRPRIAEQDVASMLRVLRALRRREPLLDRLDQITQPTLIMVGDEDTATPPERSHRMHDAIRGSQLRIVSGAGHMSAIERPEEVTAVLREFLAAVPSG
jgi:3-oxoadipate enol-lactonase